jgi:organic hydroperoxide reductase OsmC/OhrA
MQSYPHLYTVEATAQDGSALRISAADLPDLASDAPREFDGPGNQWSPESLLCASMAACFVLTFRAMARASKLNWRRLSCRVDGKLERADGAARFTLFTTQATLEVPTGTDLKLCSRLLEKAEGGCLISNSVRAKRELTSTVVEV